MRTIRRLIHAVRSGAARSRTLAYLLGLVLAIGYLGLLNHKYEHFGDREPDLTCHLCIAGDSYTPVTQQPSAAVNLTAESAPAGDHYLAPHLRTPRTAHTVRAPPVTA